MRERRLRSGRDFGKHCYTQRRSSARTLSKLRDKASESVKSGWVIKWMHFCLSQGQEQLVHHMQELTWSVGLLIMQGRKSIKHSNKTDMLASVRRTHRWLAIVRLADVIQNHILDENSHGFQYERHKQMHVDVVSRAVEFSVKADKWTVRWSEPGRISRNSDEVRLVRHRKGNAYLSYR